VLLTRLYLRNFRVYEDELDLELPPGLVGIYGPNGAGKSTLLEAVVWTLFGESRTKKDLVRTSGVGGDCVTEVEFEHEGHVYLVRRSLTGINATPRLEAHCDGLVMSEGVRDGERYMESVLGLDLAAFRASVFAEQKQLAAFSDQTPTDRRKLVLRLLGITPLDGARDAARRDARTTSAAHTKVREALPDLGQLEVEAADADARAGAAEAVARAEAEAAVSARAREETATEAFSALDLRRQEYVALVQEGKAARQELDRFEELVGKQAVELARLDELAAKITGLLEAVDGIDAAERQIEALAPVAAAAAALERIVVGEEPPAPDHSELMAAQSAGAEADRRLAELTGRTQAAEHAWASARELARRSGDLSGEADCPVCGQALGAAFEQVQAHRAAEAAEAEGRVADLGRRVSEARQAAVEAARHRDELAKAVEAARQARSEWETADRRRRDAVDAVNEAWAALVAVAPARSGSRPPSAAALDADLGVLRSHLTMQREAARQLEGVRGRLERRASLEQSLATDRERAVVAADRVRTLREKVQALQFDPAALERAAADLTAARAASQAASQLAHQREVDAARERGLAGAAAQRLADGREQHAKLADLESEARHLSRAADLLSEFRNTIVASVGPRLALQAAELFGELTDHEYDELQVDPETYQLQISDAGKVYGLERFSGSEIDLANLALRVAISEHIHFQSGGSVGLLVLDEVFGPLDEDRKARMLLALERLRGRFRQILVVTHDETIKEQLPYAIEVVKLPGRRATARLATP
jgi:exonuclease SbcC